VVVMTTEVPPQHDLRRLPDAGTGCATVVLDEVHYLQNPYRGAVWEEVIIHLAPEVDLVCLSAKVSNAEEFADWDRDGAGRDGGGHRGTPARRLRHLYLVGTGSRRTSTPADLREAKR